MLFYHRNNSVVNNYFSRHHDDISGCPICLILIRPFTPYVFLERI
ncbi:hypothetical protein KKC1_10130 [Calderihabitans maritimus]|uniref:Uncharacterized protein n=1 Tax=Calderihabitans maritimus TaxID=1246530 RepID=A0A1Z5HQP2_9FIRM|nr:hypothetical protein KKC1_10130 [Calderihabitans maritimus]